MITDSIEAMVECVYSNIGEEWIASLVSTDGKELAAGRASTRPGALSELAEAIAEAAA